MSRASIQEMSAGVGRRHHHGAHLVGAQGIDRDAPAPAPSRCRPTDPASRPGSRSCRCSRARRMHQRARLAAPGWAPRGTGRAACRASSISTQTSPSFWKLRPRTTTRPCGIGGKRGAVEHDPRPGRHQVGIEQRQRPRLAHARPCAASRSPALSRWNGDALSTHNLARRQPRRTSAELVEPGVLADQHAKAVCHRHQTPSGWPSLRARRRNSARSSNTW